MIVFPGSFDKYNRLYRVISGYESTSEDPDIKMMIISTMPAWLKQILVMDRLAKENKKMEMNSHNIGLKAQELGVNILERLE